ncbi:hypothetical protein EVAR_40370_1 [Eumeta japonica]|uniref:Uncharacterized protein n=1 Tax=Eumeta variegata TaxID=151549 RepID=A0A4C1XKZ1_EUMVA|nr:hypothetical protein EVAR_40370_1 [Eumeta japonica]
MISNGATLEAVSGQFILQANASKEKYLASTRVPALAQVAILVEMPIDSGFYCQQLVRFQQEVGKSDRNRSTERVWFSHDNARPQTYTLTKY